MPPTQENRNIAINTPLGADALMLGSFKYVEQLGKVFELNAELVSPKEDIDFSAIVGKNVTVRLNSDTGQARFFNGYVARFAQVGSQGLYSKYHATIVPWLWFLKRRTNCRSFQNKTVPEMIKQVFRDAGYTDFKEKLNGSYQPWEYCVQYRESDFNFVARLMEHEGIYYYFEHAEGSHKLVLADAPSSHSTGEGSATLVYRPQTGLSDREYVYDFQAEQEVQPGSYATTDYNFKIPRTSLFARAQAADAQDTSSFEVFEYPGEYEQQSEGTSIAKVRVEELQSQGWRGHGRTNARGLCAGSKFTLQEYPRDSFNKEYLLTYVSVSVTGDSFGTGGGGQSGEFFSCFINVIDAQTQFRAPRSARKPLIQGPQTAIVVGPKGEEIYTDQYGRIKIQFHWDRYGKADENSSCWVRVSQSAWAGKNWGSIYIPRIGQEVIVEFLDGDPDLPIVTGRVYNGDCMPPYDLPAEKTKTTLKSNSSKGGQGFNELRFEDNKGSEQIFLHAEKDLEIRVKDSVMETIDGERHLTVNEHQFEHVEKDKHVTVKGDCNTKVSGSHSSTIEGDAIHALNGALTFSIGKDQILKISGDQHMIIAGKMAEMIGGNLSQTIGGNHQEKVGGKFAVLAAGEIHLKSVKVVLEGLSVTMKSGGSFVTVDPTGVSISGPLVKINSGGAAGSGGGSSPDSPNSPAGAPDVPKKPKVAAKAKPGADTTIDRTPPPIPAAKPGSIPVDPRAAVLAVAAITGNPLVEVCSPPPDPLRSLEDAAKSVEGTVDDLKKAAEKAAQKAQSLANQAVDAAKQAADQVEKTAQDVWNKTKSAVDDGIQKGKDVVDAVEKKVQDAKMAAEQAAKDAWDKAKETAQKAADTAKDAVNEAKDQVSNAVNQAEDEAKQAWNDAKSTAEQAAEDAKKAVDDAAKQAKAAAEQAAQAAEDAKNAASNALGSLF